MLTLARPAPTTARDARMPNPFQTLARAGVSFYRGQLVLVFGAPSAGKTFFALTLARHLSDRCLYVSADTDEQTIRTRVACMLTGEPSAAVRRGFYGEHADYYHDTVASFPAMFSFESAPTIEDIQLEAAAYDEVYGCGPSVIVVDNLLNVVAGTDNEFSGMRAIMADLQNLARAYNALVLVLHHSVKQYDNGDICPPRNAIMGGVAQLPALILSLGRPQPDRMQVAVVKNRTGIADPGAAHPHVLAFDPDTALIEDC